MTGNNNLNSHDADERISSDGTGNGSVNSKGSLTSLADLAKVVYSVQTAHILLLLRGGVIDEPSSKAILRAIDGVRLGHQPEVHPVSELVAILDERVNAAIPGEIAGASALGRTRIETTATVLRMKWRATAAEMAHEAINLQRTLVELATAHTVTIMGAFADRKAAAPTTLAHFLGGIIGSLETTWKRFPTSIDAVDRSPLGSGLLVGEVFSGDREQAATLLGFTEPIANTIDASGSVEDIVEMIEAAASQSATIRRFSTELLTWIRTDPTSFFIDERWESVPEPTHPAHAISHRLEQLNQAAHRAELDARVAIDLLRAQPYGPIGISWDSIASVVDRALDETRDVVVTAAAAVREALIVNRAYLGNRAGRLYSTASDLAAFLMEDQQLSPTAAQQIAGIAVSRLKEASLEAAQITPDIIDGAAVMVIGQELKVEMETLGRYIAPRRYIERRDVLGSPKAERTREWLAGVDTRITQRLEDVEIRRARWADAQVLIDQALAESARSDEN